jgi:hypothetical protein
MHKKKGLRTPLIMTVALAGSALPAISHAQSVRSDPGPVVDRVLEAYGGGDVVRSVDSYRQEGMLVTSRGAAHGQVYRISEGPSKLSILVDYPGRSEVRLLENGVAWRGTSPSSLTLVDGPLQGAMALQAARIALPRLLDELRAETTLAEPSEEGTAVLDIRVGEDLILRVYVEEATSLIVRTESLIESAPAMVGFATDYSDHRSVDGVVFAFREETYASGHRTATSIIESVELNPEGPRARLPIPQGN